MKFLIDMNLSPRWVEVFMAAGWDATHWFAIDDPRATDRSIMKWARSNGYIVFTHDLDFGAILAATQASGPSVIQIRAEKVLPEDAGDAVIGAIRRFQDALEQGALISVDPERARARILPLDR
jgi:predicted nuclease of predicted toxin-antitoxin system